MAKPEWGTKRLCWSCGTRFYDLNREPVVCPKCATERPADEAAKGERRVGAAPEPKPARAAADVSASDKDAEFAKLDDKDQATKKDEFIEDASELGEDEDDMAEVLEGTVEKEEGER